MTTWLIPLLIRSIWFWRSVSFVTKASIWTCKSSIASKRLPRWRILPHEHLPVNPKIARKWDHKSIIAVVSLYLVLNIEKCPEVYEKFRWTCTKTYPGDSEKNRTSFGYHAFSGGDNNCCRMHVAASSTTHPPADCTTNISTGWYGKNIWYYTVKNTGRRPGKNPVLYLKRVTQNLPTVF